MKLLRDTWLIFQRQMVLVLRNPVWVVIGILQPLYFLLLFGPLLKDALQAPTTADAYRFFVPGLLVMLAMFGSMFVGFGLIAELRAGVIERSRVTPISRLALMLGRALRDVATLVVQAALITVLAIPFGLTVRVGDVLLAYLMLGLIGLMLSAASNAIALKLRSEDALAPLMNGVAQPLLLLSGILLPLTGWVATVADFNPFSWAVDASRALFAGNPGDDSVWQALLILGALTALTLFWSARAFARSVR
ncbi:ABC transporter permease [Phytohabitans flavus]|uniref:Transport permease protein n=1 Tax=Phytohabitans flavus TaxID=1076124 RepID=A0A6F8Y1M1_9ACTN|nr:ABC transporter permease [Phytohabitans flavus]BCB79953.1 transport permease protein [Phytohabitans flavus]